jgi:hypothetical protein
VLERPTLQALAAHIDALNGTTATDASTAPASPPLHDAPTTDTTDGTSVNGHANGHANGHSNASKGSNGSAADVIDLPAEAAKLDPSVYPAPTRKAGYSRFR